jgi:hypothetical protein
MSTWGRADVKWKRQNVRHRYGDVLPKWGLGGAGPEKSNV